MPVFEVAHSVQKPVPEEPRMQPSSNLILVMPPLYYHSHGKVGQ